ncbi:hypothetical protein GCM10010082_08050 [Kushneria pakistanensis]|uniref:DUF429 domain-containing protein n=1 Tax=Kushneria pakistanensis TaxID=1508770 RepID=A0ABQ3FD21_9GAMM|nr:DUF429 domain-containing protein [Kushneria pakistanensis]GHC18978.1 hypothetical protein GCM10010082_08050 [Kushneria pakistanensis]
MVIAGIDRLLHADWSLSPSKRWYAQARRIDGQWLVSDAARIEHVYRWRDNVLMSSDHGTTLAGFDFPIGVPAQWAARAGVTDFRAWLAMLDTPRWQQFFDTASTPEEISLTRPFYPQHATRGVSQSDLTQALDVEDFDALRRGCERDMPGRKPCPLFWTLGANQVGKAAQTGWCEVILPALDQGVALWPFDGALEDLAQTHHCILCETWPTLAARLMRAGFSGRQSKRRQTDRLDACRHLLESDLPVTWEVSAKASLESGFGERADGEDAFDAMLGLLMMIAIVEGKLPVSSVLSCEERYLEGWILGLCRDATAVQ